MDLRHTPGTTINFLFWHIYRIFPVCIFQVLSSWSFFFGWRFFFGCSSSSSSSLLSTLKIVTRQKVGRSTVTRTWQTLVCKKYSVSRKVFSTNLQVLIWQLGGVPRTGGSRCTKQSSTVLKPGLGVETAYNNSYCTLFLRTVKGGVFRGIVNQLRQLLRSWKLISIVEVVQGFPMH